MLKMLSKIGGQSGKPNAEDGGSSGTKKASSFKGTTASKTASGRSVSKTPKKSDSKGSSSSRGSSRSEPEDGRKKKLSSKTSKEDLAAKERHVVDASTGSHTGESLLTGSSLGDPFEGALPGILIGGMRKDFEGTEKSGHLEGVPISVRLTLSNEDSPLQPEEQQGQQPTRSQQPSKNPKHSSSTAKPAETPELELMPALEACSAQDSEEQLKGLTSLRILSRGHKLTRMDMVTAGTVETVLLMQSTENRQVLNMMLLVLLNLTFDDENVNEMGVIIPFVERCLSYEDDEVVENAAAIVFSLSRLEEHRTALLSPTVVEPLVKILASGTGQGKRDSCKALFHLSYLPESYPILLEMGVVEPSIQLLQPPDSKIAEKAICLLANISRCKEGCRAIAECEEGLANLVDVLGEGSHMAKEFAAAALLLIAESDKELKNDVVLESPFIALNGLQNMGTARAKLKASALLRLLRDEERAAEKD